MDEEDFYMSDNLYYPAIALNPIKEVKRVAEAGEFVKIVNATVVPGDDYKNGDIIKVLKKGWGDHVKYAEGYKNSRCRELLPKEYVVLEGYEDCDQVKKFDEISAGDSVEVTDKGKTYSSYSRWAGLKDFKGNFVEGKQPNTNKKYKVLRVRKHETAERMLALIQDPDTTQVFIIGVDGIKKA
jgi:hypothetical protein